VEKLYIVKHRHVLYDDVYETKSIGWYSSRAKAIEAIERSKVLEGFRDYPDGYAIVEIEVDRIYES
jgi:hypothetical protein